MRSGEYVCTSRIALDIDVAAILQGYVTNVSPPCLVYVAVIYSLS